MKTAIDKTLAKADLFRIVSIGFSYPEIEKFENLSTIINEILDDSELELKIQNLLEELLLEINYITILKDYSRVFLKGTIPTTETSICEKINCIPDVSAFYKAFGMKAKSGDSPDSIVYESEFAALLLIKMALAKEKEKFDVAENAYITFMNDHLRLFAEKFAEKLETIEPIKFYSVLSNILVEITKN